MIYWTSEISTIVEGLTMETAFSYIRFSYGRKELKESIDRQRSKRDAWLKRHPEVALDDSLAPDKGVSALTGKHRKNADRHALAMFLEMVKQDRVPNGSYLIVEALDRLTREHIRAALMLILGLIEDGVRIVQLTPTETVYDANSDEYAIMQLILELMRGHNESKLKSERIGATWGMRKQAAAKTKAVITTRVPPWLRVDGRRTENRHRVGGEFVADPGKAAAVRRAFELAAEGYGYIAAAKKLNEEGAPPMRGSSWTRKQVVRLLNSRAVLGEYAPTTKLFTDKERRVGAAVQGYYPQIIDDDLFHAAQGAKANRTRRGGRPPRKHVNVFAGLLLDARTGTGFNRKGTDLGPVLVPYAAAERGGSAASFPLEALERAVKESLKEVKLADVLPKRGGDRAAALEGRLAKLEANAEKLVERIAADYSDDLAEALKRCRAEQEPLKKELAEARREAASPLPEAWSRAKALAAAPDDDETRVRLRTAMRRVCESAHALFARNGCFAYAWVQLRFKGSDAPRNVLVRWAPRERDVRFRTQRKQLEFDLRDPAHSEAMEGWLSGTPDVELRKLLPPSKR
jgi:DNA invertase Pin-like site-specific DNA recombinase